MQTNVATVQSVDCVDTDSRQYQISDTQAHETSAVTGNTVPPPTANDGAAAMYDAQHHDAHGGHHHHHHHHAGAYSSYHAHGRQSSAKPIDIQRYKTKMCRTWSATGHCPYLDRCMFAHGDHELRCQDDNQHLVRRRHPTPMYDQQHYGAPYSSQHYYEGAYSSPTDSQPGCYSHNPYAAPGNAYHGARHVQYQRGYYDGNGYYETPPHTPNGPYYPSYDNLPSDVGPSEGTSTPEDNNSQTPEGGVYPSGVPVAEPVTQGSA